MRSPILGIAAFILIIALIASIWFWVHVFQQPSSSEEETKNDIIVSQEEALCEEFRNSELFVSCREAILFTESILPGKVLAMGLIEWEHKEDMSPIPAEQAIWNTTIALNQSLEYKSIIFKRTVRAVVIDIQQKGNEEIWNVGFISDGIPQEHAFLPKGTIRAAVSQTNDFIIPYDILD